MKLQLSSKKMIRLLLWLVIALNIIGMAARAIEKSLGYNNTFFVRLVDVSEEANITSWFSSLLLFFSALLLLLITRLKTVEKDTFSRHWAILSYVFLYLSLDEAAKIHEATIKPLRSIFNASGFFYYAWVIIAIPIILLLGIFYMRFIFSLPGKTRNYFILAAGLFIAGALGFEMIAGFYYDVEISGIYLSSIFITFEELLENLGVLVFISALLSYIKLQPGWKNTQLEFV
jgi:hypothetical protein